MTTPIHHNENRPRKKEPKVECTRSVVNSRDSKTAGGVSSPLSLPQASKHLPSTKSPSIPQENTHYSLALRLTAPPRVTLKHCSLSQRNTSTRWESRVNWTNAGCLPFSTAILHDFWAVFFPFSRFLFWGLDYFTSTAAGVSSVGVLEWL